MDLLSDEHRKDFRYYIFEDLKLKEIVILFTFEDKTSLDESHDCELEVYHLNKWTPNKSNWIKSSCYENETTINKFNSDIRSFLNKADSGVEKISIINSSYARQFIFEASTFKAIVDKCKDIYIDININSAIRLADYDYGQINSLEIESGMIIVEETCDLYIDTLKANRCNFNIYNEVNGKHCLNLNIGASCKINSMRQYAPLKLVILNKIYNSTTFLSSKCTINCLTIYGTEFIKSDVDKERIFLKGFNKTVINRLVVERDVKYGILFNIDLMSSLLIGEFSRTIDEISAGSAIIINRVAKVNINDINLQILSTATISDNYSICSFIPSTDSSLKRSININESEIVNTSSKTVYIVKLNNNTIEKLYFSNCNFGSDIIPFNKDTKSTITNLYYLNSTFKIGEDFEISGASRISMIDCDLSVNGNLFISGTYISINGGIWDFNNFTISNDALIKLSILKTEMTGIKLLIDNNDVENDILTSLKEVKLKMSKSIIMTNIKCSIIDSYIHTALLQNKTKNSLKLLNVLLGFVNNVCNLTVMGSLSGSVLFNSQDDKSKFNLNINDKDKIKFLATNSLNMSSTDYSPVINMEIDRPLITTITGMTQSNNYIKFMNTYDCKTASIIKYSLVNAKDCECVLINNSEKLSNIVKSIDNYGLKTYTINKK